MKRFYAIMGILLLVGCIIFISCKKATTEEPTPLDNTPVLSFLQGSNYISGDTTVLTLAQFQLGVVCQQNQNSQSKLSSFSVVKTFNNIPNTVFDTSNLNVSTFLWDVTEYANANAGEETWVFTLEDEAGKTSELIFVITTYETAYTPTFSPTYLVVNNGGTEMLDFYITCVTDDWEMIKVIVTWPGGLGSETYTGNGQIITAGSPFTFSNYFPKLEGNWTFSILGYIKSGVHVNESFTTKVSIVVTVK